MKPVYQLFILILIPFFSFSQVHIDTIQVVKPDSLSLIRLDSLHLVHLDSLPVVHPDTIPLRIKNLNPYFTLHTDSVLQYKFEINKDQSQYYWFIKKSPVGIKINKDNGTLTSRVDKSFFLSGRLQYDKEYNVPLSVQNLNDPKDRVDTSFTIVFYNTEIVPSKIKPTVTSNLTVEEGDTVSFKLQCENGNFPIQDITYISNYAIKSSTNVAACGDVFTWTIPYSFIKENEKQRKVDLYFIGTNKFHNTDTTLIQILVKESINYPQQTEEFENLRKEMQKYILQLKSSFRIVDKKIKKTKKTRTTFDLSSAAAALGGTIFSSLPNKDQQAVGKILPSVGVAIVPVKEASAPNSSSDQNMATLIRSAIKRLEYLLSQTRLIGPKDNDILNKSKKLSDELKQTQIQLIDIPFAEESLNEKELDEYFNNPKVNKKYRIKKSVPKND